MVINIGAPAINRNSYKWYGVVINKNGSADKDGTITTINIYVHTQMTEAKVATFYDAGGGTLSTRDWEGVQVEGQSAGVIPTGFSTFTVNLDVAVGDYIGIYYTAGRIDAQDTGGSGCWRAYDGTIPCTEGNFVFSGTCILSLNGTGETEEEEEEDNAIFIGCNL